MNNEYELIKHNSIHSLKVFLVSLAYRESHVHSDLEVCYILDGEATIYSKNQELHLKKYDFTLINSYQPHELRADNNALILALQVNPKFCKEYYPQISDLEFDFCIGSQHMPKFMQDICFGISIKIAHHYYLKKAEFEFRCIGLLNILFYHFIKNVPYQLTLNENKNNIILKNQKIQRIITYVEENYNQKLLLSDIAENEKLTVTYLSHFFHDNFGITFQEYLNSLRCEKARQLLLLTDYNMLTISLESGFSDIKYLNKAFKDRYKCTPAHYRVNFSQADLPEQQKSMLSTQNFLSDNSSLIILEQYYEQANKIFSDSFLNDVL